MQVPRKSCWDSNDSIVLSISVFLLQREKKSPTWYNRNRLEVHKMERSQFSENTRDLKDRDVQVLWKLKTRQHFNDSEFSTFSLAVLIRPRGGKTCSFNHMKCSSAGKLTSWRDGICQFFPLQFTVYLIIDIKQYIFVVGNSPDLPPRCHVDTVKCKMHPMCDRTVYCVKNVALEFNISLFVSDSETTEDEGEDQYETKDDVGNDEDQTTRTGIHLLNVSCEFISRQGDCIHANWKVPEKTGAQLWLCSITCSSPVPTSFNISRKNKVD